MLRRIWKEFLSLFFLTLIVSIFLTALLLNLFSKRLSLKGIYLDENFFNTLWGAFTTVGLTMAIFQLAALRKEKEIRRETTNEQKRKNFVEDAIIKFADIHRQLQELQINLNHASVFSESILNGYTNQINIIINSLTDLHLRQSNLTVEPAIDCENCITLLSNLYSDFSKVIEDDLYKTFRKQHYNIKLREIITKVSECEIKLKA